MPFPFEVPFAEVESNLDGFVDEVFGALQSEFLNLPKGDGFVDYPTFSKGYQEIKAATHDFRDLSLEPIVATIYRTPISLIVLRTILYCRSRIWSAPRRYEKAFAGHTRQGLHPAKHAALD